MPIPKKMERSYGLIVGHLQNLGFSRSVAKKKADKAIADHPSLAGNKTPKRKTKKTKK